MTHHTQKQYAERVYKNPYFRGPKKKTRLRLILSGLGIGLALFGTLFLFLFNGFAIKHISIRGVEASSRESFQKHVSDYLDKKQYGFFQNTNRFLFSQQDLNTVLKEFFKFDQMHIERKKNTLTINVSERSSRFIWSSNKLNYFSDENGVILKQEELLPGTTPLKLPLFVDRNNIPVHIGDTTLSSDEVKNTFRFHELIKTMRIEPKETQVDRLAGKWIGVVTDLGYTILFDATGNVDEQAGRLEVLLKDTVKDQSKLKYIDLRFGDHVYFK